MPANAIAIIQELIMTISSFLWTKELVLNEEIIVVYLEIYHILHYSTGLICHHQAISKSDFQIQFSPDPSTIVMSQYN